MHEPGVVRLAQCPGDVGDDALGQLRREALLAIEALGEDAARHPLELTFVARPGQPGMAHVVADVERRIVDPDRVALDRRAHDALAIARDAVEDAPRGLLVDLHVDAAVVVDAVHVAELEEIVLEVVVSAPRITWDALNTLFRG